MTEASDNKLMKRFDELLEKLIKTVEGLNGVTVNGISVMVKSIAQESMSIDTNKTKRKQIVAELKINKTQLDMKEKLKGVDEHLVRLRHKLNMDQEREHGEQVRRNISLRRNMDNFNEALSKTKQAIMGGAGFQSALGTTVKKMAGMTRGYQEHEIALQQLTTAEESLEDAFDKLAEAFRTGDDADVTRADKEVDTKIGEVSKAEDRASDTYDDSKETQGRFKPLFEKLSKLGDFLGKKAIPIGIGVGVAGIFMSIIVKAFSASPLFAAMMKLMKFMVTLILMPIGTFFGALLRPILIMLLRKFIVPMYSKWMPAAITMGTELGEWIASWSWESFMEAINSLNPFHETETEAEKAARLEAEKKEAERIAKEGTEGTTTPDGNYQVTEQSDLDFIQFTKDLKALWELIKNPAGDTEKTINVDTGEITVNQSTLVPSTIFTSIEDFVKKTIKDNPDGGVVKDDAYYDSLNDPNINPNKFNANGETEYDPHDPANNRLGETEADRKYQEAREELARLEKEELDRKLILANDQAILDAKLAKIERDKHVKQAAEKAAERAAAAAAAVERAKEVAKTLARSNAIFASHGTGENSNFSNSNGQYSSSNNGQTGNTPERGAQTLDGRGRLSSGAYANRGISEGAYEKASAPRGHVNTSASNKSNLKPETVALFKAMGISGYAQGFDGMINSPTLFMAGEAGAEHVKVTPSSQGGGGSGGSNITVNIQNMNAGDDDLRKLKKTILEVIQQSSANRGRL